MQTQQLRICTSVWDVSVETWEVSTVTVLIRQNHACMHMQLLCCSVQIIVACLKHIDASISRKIESDVIVLNLRASHCLQSCTRTHCRAACHVTTAVGQLSRIFMHVQVDQLTILVYQVSPWMLSIVFIQLSRCRCRSVTACDDRGKIPRSRFYSPLSSFWVSQETCIDIGMWLVHCPLIIVIKRGWPNWVILV